MCRHISEAVGRAPSVQAATLLAAFLVALRAAQDVLLWLCLSRRPPAADSAFSLASWFFFCSCINLSLVLLSPRFRVHVSIQLVLVLAKLLLRST